MFKKRKRHKSKCGCGKPSAKKKIGLSQSEFNSLVDSITINDNFKGVVKTVVKNVKGRY